jgi:uncharacterized membrane protein
MAVVKRSVDIQAPVEMVWQWLTDRGQILTWNEQYVRFSIIEDVPGNVGTRYVTVEKFRGTMLRNDCVITEWVENQRFGFKGENSEFSREGAYLLSPRGDACHVALEMTVTPKGGPMKKAVSKMLVEKPYEVEVDALLTDLKHGVEAAYHADQVIRV